MSLSPVRESDAPSLADVVCGLPLAVAFAEGEAIEAARRGEDLTLAPPFHVSDDDAYLVLPDDIGIEIIDIFADADHDLLGESFRDGVVVVGETEGDGRGGFSLAVESLVGIDGLMGGTTLPYGSEVWVGGPYDPVEVLNDLDAAQVTVASQLVDENGFRKMLETPRFLGASWTAGGASGESTYAYARHLDEGRVGIEAALFVEYEELVMLLRPAVLVPAPSGLQLVR